MKKKLPLIIFCTFAGATHAQTDNCVYPNNDTSYWGWDDIERLSCPPLISSSCIDTDPVGDGWGWDGITSCQITETTDTTETTDDNLPLVSICTDTAPIGDGWAGTEQILVVFQ